MAERIDFIGEGLLDGLTGRARMARLSLLEALADDGVPLEELRAAVDEGRLALLPVDRALADGEPLTDDDVAQRVGIPVEEVRRYRAMIGAPVPPPGEPAWSTTDADTLIRLLRFAHHGFDPQAMEDATRTFGLLAQRAAQSTHDMIADSTVGDDLDERTVALRYADLAAELMPEVGPMFSHLFRVHMQELLRHDAIDHEALAAGGLSEGTERAIGFADLVGFTPLGEQVTPEELGALAGRFAARAVDEVAARPVTLVKTIGDAVLLSAQDAAPLVETLLGLIDWSDEEGELRLRCGAAWGDVLERAGDVYGRPVNLAARAAEAARPGTVLGTDEVRAASEDDFDWSRAGRRRLKGIGRVPLHRARRLP